MTKKENRFKQISVVDQVSDHLMARIAEGELKVGDQLPSEADMASFYGVNRMTVRMALQKLSVLGLVDTKVGEGSFITEVSLERIFSAIPASMFSYSSLEDVLRLRRLLELDSIKLAIANASDEEFEELYALAEDADRDNGTVYRDVTEDIINRRIEKDYRFHRHLVECSKNMLYSQLFRILEIPIKGYLFSIISMRIAVLMEKNPSGLGTHSMHTKLCDAMRERDWKKSKKIYLNMTEYTIKVADRPVAEDASNA